MQYPNLHFFPKKYVYLLFLNYFKLLKYLKMQFQSSGYAVFVKFVADTFIPIHFLLFFSEHRDRPLIPYSP